MKGQFILTFLRNMGVSYSQPPRGYQYSTQNFYNETCTLEVEPEFTSFEDLYFHNYEFEKNLSYMIEISDNSIISYSYEKCYKMYKSVISFFLQNHIKSDSVIAIYSDASLESQIIANSALLFGYQLILLSPSSVPVDRFCSLVKKFSPFSIYCQLDHANSINRCFPQSLIITNSDSKYHSFQKILRTTSNNTITPLIHDESFDPVIYFSTSGTPIPLKSCELFTFISKWSEKLKICRDAVIASIIPCDDNVFRLVNFACIRTRAKLCFPSSFDTVKNFNATHLFVSSNSINTEMEMMNRKIQHDLNIFSRLNYHIGYVWKRLWVSIGSQTSKFESVFKRYQHDFGPNFHFAFVTGPLKPSVHEQWMVLYAKPLSPVFIPYEWGNVGTSLPCDIKFVKLGTLGGPINNSIKIDETTHKIGSRINNVEIDKQGFWDEEGALVITSENI